MTNDEALALYHAGPKVVTKILCDLSHTIESLQEQIKVLEAKVAKLSKNSSNSSKPPSSDDITRKTETNFGHGFSKLIFTCCSRLTSPVVQRS